MMEETPTNGDCASKFQNHRFDLEGSCHGNAGPPAPYSLSPLLSPSLCLSVLSAAGTDSLHHKCQCSSWWLKTLSVSPPSDSRSTAHIRENVSERKPVSVLQGGFCLASQEGRLPSLPSRLLKSCKDLTLQLLEVVSVTSSDAHGAPS